MITTFYSYKGGTGRSQMLVNIAACLCYRKQKKVLVIDWDLEAPGVDFYFHFDRNKIQHGLIDFLHQYSRVMRENNDVTEEILPNYKDFVTENIISHNEGKVDLLAAGNYNEDYARKIAEFDWLEFYDSLDGKTFVEDYWKPQLKNDYDFVLIDSRTGLNDYSGICNVQMPDVNLILIAPNEQNMWGAERVIASLQKSDYIKKRRGENAVIIPILSRVDDSIESDRIWEFKEKFLDLAINCLHPSLNNELKKYAKDILNKEKTLIIEYKRDISWGENLLFSAEEKRGGELKEKYEWWTECLMQDISEIKNKTFSERFYSQYITELYKNEKETIIFYCLKYVENKETAEDICNDVFINVFRFEKIQDIDNIRYYMYVCARQQCEVYLKKQKNVKLIEQIEDESLSDEENFLEKIKIEQLYAEMKKLPEEQKYCIELFFFERKSYKEIAEITGYSEKNIKSFLQNGKHNLGNLLKLFLEEE